MDSRSQNDSDGGGGHHGWSPSLTSLPSTPHDEQRQQPWPPQTHSGPLDAGLNNGQLPHAPVLSLDQIRITGSSNEYTEGPTVVQRSPFPQQRQQKDDLLSSAGSRTSVQLESREERPNNLHNLHSLTQHGNTNTSSSREGVLRSSSVEDSQSSIRTSVGSTSSGQRLLSSPAGGDPIIRTQPKRAELNSEELKPLNDEPRAVVAVPGTGGHKSPGKHSNKCESCGQCQCADCSRPRVLPSCWMCGHRCVCSAQNAVEYGTCVCCIKGLFYHCSSDDEDTCADKPFSCTQARCCVRWTTVSLLSLLFPCLLCYLPAKGCVAMCQSCYDRVTRPGCRCKNTKPIHCEDVGKQT